MEHNFKSWHQQNIIPLKGSPYKILGYLLLDISALKGENVYDFWWNLTVLTYSHMISHFHSILFLWKFYLLPHTKKISLIREEMNLFEPCLVIHNLEKLLFGFSFPILKKMDLPGNQKIYLTSVLTKNLGAIMKKNKILKNVLAQWTVAFFLAASDIGNWWTFGEIKR